MSRKVRVRINKQQAEVLDRMVARGEPGESRAAVIRKGFLEFARGQSGRGKRRADDG
jgi:hypothetical protein